MAVSVESVDRCVYRIYRCIAQWPGWPDLYMGMVEAPDAYAAERKARQNWPHVPFWRLATLTHAIV